MRKNKRLQKAEEKKIQQDMKKAEALKRKAGKIKSTVEKKKINN